MNFTQVKLMDVGDWDQLVMDTYGRTYCFQQQDDCKSRVIYRITVPVQYPYDYKNDTIPEEVNGEDMGVSFKAWLARDPEAPIPETQFLDMFWNRNFYPHADMIANDLHARGLLGAGQYIIKIDW
jgi:hypothetical protein